MLGRVIFKVEINFLEGAKEIMVLKIGGYSRVVTITGSYTVLGHEDVILCNASGGAFSVTLPAAASIGEKIVTIKKIDTSSNVVTVSRSGTDTIDGYTSIPIATTNGVAQCISNLSNWYTSQAIGFVGADCTMTSGSVTSGNPIDYSNKVYDTHGSVTTGASWKFTAQFMGYYQVSGVNWTGASTANIRLFKNGAVNRYVDALSTLIKSYSTTIFLSTGDYIDIRPDASVSLTTGTDGSRVTIERLG